MRFSTYIRTIVSIAIVFQASAQAQSLTPVQQAIVRAARNVSGASPASQTSLYWNGRTWSTWQTDTAGGDGQRMRDAIKRFATWRNANLGKPVPASLIAAMKADVYTYPGSYGAVLVNRIISQYDTKQALCRCSLVPPQTEDQTLAFLGVRAQCREFVDTTVIKAGGTPRAYGVSVQTAAKNFRPGMGLFFPNIPHASIITDIYYNPNGSVTFRIAESNWGTGWTNPSGMVPWERTLQNVRTLDWLGNNTCRTGNSNYTCQVVSFE
jgi:hypothetical protein